jgi:hypothetical protein
MTIQDYIDQGVALQQSTSDLSAADLDTMRTGLVFKDGLAYFPSLLDVLTRHPEIKPVLLADPTFQQFVGLLNS